MLRQQAVQYLMEELKKGEASILEGGLTDEEAIFKEFGIDPATSC